MEEVHEFETLFHCTEMKYNEEVAPLAGAWIETETTRGASGLPLSHPSRVRGLKHRLCIDSRARRQVAPLAGAWIETTVYVLDIDHQLSRRTPRGCVD
ncbi:hypothetical protein S1OALGB6SA_15 [Olavius algarvensis spirochete endosymbiont]|nr:hypothetical protein S1OALGB6SA_15 [Olavius algarvensis spirochete endosymbiont]